MKGKKERVGRGRGEKEHGRPQSLHFSMFILATRATERSKDLECRERRIVVQGTGVAAKQGLGAKYPAPPSELG